MRLMRDYKLPEFVKNHVLVAFHRDDSEDERSKAFSAQSDQESDMQQRLQEPEADQVGDGAYVTDDVVVVHAPGKAQGVTSFDPMLPRDVPNDLEGTLDVFDLEFTDGTRPSDYNIHRPILDIDFGAALIPSSTEGHFHLYLDKPMTWKNYKRLLNVMAEVGVIEPGYAQASIERGYSSTRLPWVKKEESK